MSKPLLPLEKYQIKKESSAAVKQPQRIVPDGLGSVDQNGSLTGGVHLPGSVLATFDEDFHPATNQYPTETQFGRFSISPMAIDLASVLLNYSQVEATELTNASRQEKHKPT